MLAKQKSSVALLAWLLLAWATPRTGFAQEASEEDEAVYSVNEAVEAPEDIQDKQRSEARKDGTWAATVAGTAGAGFDSNVHESPSNTKKSAFEYVGVGLEGLKYFGDSHRLRLDFEADGRHYEEEVRADPYRVEGHAFYGYRPKAKWSAGTDLSVKHRNDSATTIDGQLLARSLAYVSYRQRTSLWLHPTKKQDLELSLTAQRRDYEETAGIESLDWWKVGTRLEIDHEVSRRVDAEAAYSFVDQSYDEEPSSDSAGVESTTYPAEDHFYHTLDLGFEFEITRDLDADIAYEYRRRTDRFEGYESYSGNGAEAGFDWTPGKRWHLVAFARFQARDYDERPAAGPGTLAWDRWTAGTSAFFRISKWLSAYVAYGLDWRDTNGSTTSISFRDYERHIVTAGVSASR